jgi:hypothetical protein
MKKQTYTLTDAQIAALRVLFKKTGMSKSEHIRRALDAYIHGTNPNRNKPRISQSR